MLTGCQRKRRTLLLAGCCFSLSACQPELNWRQIHDEEGHFSILLPGKPASAMRQLQLAGIPCTMNMRGVHENALIFSVGWIDVSDIRQTGIIWQAMLQGMLANIGSAVPRSTAPGDTLRVQGKDQRGTQIAMHARFLIRGQSVFQLIATGPAEKLDQTVSDTFLQSFTTDTP